MKTRHFSSSEFEILDALVSRSSLAHLQHGREWAQIQTNQDTDLCLICGKLIEHGDGEQFTTKIGDHGLLHIQESKLRAFV